MKLVIAKVAFIALLCSGTAWAAPTVQVESGRTTVQLDAGFLAALESLGLAPSAIAPAKLKGKSGKVRFPIPAGSLDTASFEGDILHTGGLSLSAGETTVDLYNFVIETYSTVDPLTSELRAPRLTASAALNGDTLGRYPVFDLDLVDVEIKVTRSGVVRIKNVAVTLSAAGALALNAAFSPSPAIEPGLLIGIAQVRTFADLHD